MTQMLPTRLRTLIALTNLLKTITPSNGYATDLSDFIDDTGVTQGRVFRGRIIFGEDDPLPMVSILENPHTEPTQHQSPRGSTSVIGPWELMIQGFIEDDKDHPSDPAHILLADVKKCLAQERAKVQTATAMGMPPNLLGMGSVVDDLTIGAGLVRPPDSVSAKANYWLTVTLQMREDMTNPFA